MPDLVTIPGEVLGAAVLLTLVAIGLLVARRRLLAHGRWAMLLAIEQHGRWRLGMARPDAQRIEWFPMRAVRLQPAVVWLRHEFELGPLDPDPVSVAGLTDAVQLDGTFGGRRYRVAVSRFDYTALRSWSESAPPGLTVPVES